MLVVGSETTFFVSGLIFKLLSRTFLIEVLMLALAR